MAPLSDKDVEIVEAYDNFLLFQLVNSFVLPSSITLLPVETAHYKKINHTSLSLSMFFMRKTQCENKFMMSTECQPLLPNLFFTFPSS